MRSMRQRSRMAVLSAVVVAMMVFAPLTAMAHEVGVPGTATCFGLRISHGSKAEQAGGHGWTPVERAAMLQGVVDFLREYGSPEEMALVEEFFGETVSVQEMIRFVKANCSDNPIVPSD